MLKVAKSMVMSGMVGRARVERAWPVTPAASMVATMATREVEKCILVVYEDCRYLDAW